MPARFKVPDASRAGRRSFLLGGLAALFLMGCGIFLKTRGPSVAVKAPAPAFSLPSHTGATVSLADLTRNGPAVLVFYRGHW